MRIVNSFLVGTVLLLGCQVDAGEAGNGPLSGDRLQAQWINGSDGSRQFAGWVDTETMYPCEFTTLHESSLRCVPGLIVRPMDIRYADDECRKPAVIGTGTKMPPKYFTWLSNDYKEAGLLAFRLSGSSFEFAGTFRARFSSGCHKIGLEVTGTYPAAVELPVDFFVEGTLSQE